MNKYLSVLRMVLSEVKTLQSDYVRANVFLVAEAASRGHITALSGGKSCNRWFLTLEGHKFLTEMENPSVKH